LIASIETTGALSTSFASSLIIAFGVLYILLFMISRLRDKPGMLTLSYACFAVLLANTLVLAAMLHFDAYAISQVLGALVAYLLVPHAILHLLAGRGGKAT